MKKGYLGLAVLIGLSLSVSMVSAKMTKEAHQYYQQASVCEYKQDMKGAITLIQKAIEVNNDDDVMLYTKLGGLFANVEQYQDAIAAYKKASELRPNDAFIFVSLGSIYQTIGDNNNALIAYNKALELCPEYKYNYINIANVQLAQKKYVEAEDYYKRFLELYPENDEARANLAETYFMNDKPEQACEIFKTMYAKNPEGFKEYAKFGTALYKMKSYKEAIPILKKAVEQDENSVKSLAQLALCYQNTDDFATAEQTYAKMFEIAPGMNEFRLDYANMLSAQQKDQEAIKQYNDYIKAYPKDADGYVNLGALYKRINNTDLAIENFEKAFELDPNDMDTVKDLAFCYHKKNDYQKALKYYNIALEKDADNYSLNYNKAIALHALEKYPEAIASYEKVLTIKEDEVIKTNLTAALIEYGFKLLDGGKTAESRANFQKAIELNKKEPSGYFGTALTYRQEGNKEMAVSYFQKAVDLDPKNEEYAGAYDEFKNTLTASDLEKMATMTDVPKDVEYATLLAAGDKYYKNRNYKSAMSPYEKALAINPNNKELLLKLGNIYKNEKNLSKSGEYYRKAIALDDKYTDAWFNLGLVYANTNKLNDAIDCFNKVISIDNKYTYAYYALGLAYEYEHNNARAVENYKKYVKLEQDQGLVSNVNNKIKQLQK